jgi:UTP--glucose-1-phosphate uridylyltransferase
MPAASFDESTQRLLRDYGFDATTFEGLRARVRRGVAAAQAENTVRGRIEPPGPGELIDLPAPGTPPHAQLVQRGQQAIAAGQVGVVVLAGGMATRFGGGVKAAAEALPGRSFLDLKLADFTRAATAAGGRVPAFLLVSFATHQVVAELGARASSAAVPIETVPQFVSLRLGLDGEIFLGKDGQPSPYAPGHGDLTFALRASGALARFRGAGGKLLFMSNVDNLGATLDPAVIGAHLTHGRAVTVETVRKERGDAGGAPARVDGVLQIVEGFRFPPDYKQEQLTVFNTNTFVFDAAAIDRDFPLTWFCVKKKVDGVDVLQFERLVGEVTAFLPSSFLVVPRHGNESRFEPVKDLEELAARQGQLAALLAARGIA